MKTYYVRLKLYGWGGDLSRGGTKDRSDKSLSMGFLEVYDSLEKFREECGNEQYITLKSEEKVIH